MATRDEIIEHDDELFEERAAIREFDGGYDQDEAERLAYFDVMQVRIARHSKKPTREQKVDARRASWETQS